MFYKKRNVLQVVAVAAQLKKNNNRVQAKIPLWDVGKAILAMPNAHIAVNIPVYFQTKTKTDGGTQ